MEGQQNPNEPGKSGTPGQQGGQQQDREKQERERQQREREKQGGQQGGGRWRSTGWWRPTGWSAKRTISLVILNRKRREGTPAALFVCAPLESRAIAFAGSVSDFGQTA